MNLVPHCFLRYLIDGIEIEKDKPFYFIDEKALRHAGAKVLGIVSSMMLILAIFLNLLEGNYSLLAPLLLSLLLIVPHFFLLRMTKGSSMYSLLSMTITLMLLGAYLVLVHSIPDGSSLFWFMLLPPMLMLCIGIRYGTVLYVVFYIFLLMLFATPLDRYLAYDYPNSLRVRFLSVMMGTYIFSFLAELVRLNTYRAFQQAVKMLERNALTDPLTALGNRRDFQNYFVTNQMQATRSNRDFSVALVDIDFFKNVNDTYGHQVGDFVLCHVAAILASQLRVTDRLFRWGGEEFVILMPETGYTEARIIAERLRGEIEKTPYIMENIPPIFITVSIGMHCGNLSESAEVQMSIADKNLYKAKNMGRNQVQG